MLDRVFFSSIIYILRAVEPLSPSIGYGFTKRAGGETASVGCGTEGQHPFFVGEMPGAVTTSTPATRRGGTFGNLRAILTEGGDNHMAKKAAKKAAKKGGKKR